VRSCAAFVVCLLVLTGCSLLSPIPPDAPAGPSSGVVGVPQLFSTMTRDRQGDSIAYRFDWGDGTLSDWSTLAASSARVSAAHAWDLPGDHLVRVRARDKGGHVSAWSQRHRVSIISYAGFPDSVMEPIVGGKDPVGIAVNPDGLFLYVAARGDDEVRVIRPGDRSLVARVPVGSAPHAVCVLPNGQFAYVANSRSENVSVIRLSDNKVVATVPVQGYPIFCCATPNSRAVYVTNYGSGTVSVIGTGDNTVKTTIPVGEVPWGIAVPPDGRYVYVGLSGSDKLKKISASNNKVVGEVTVHPGPEGMSVLPGGEYLYVACRTRNSGSIDVIRTSDDSLVASTPVSGYPVDVVPLAGGEYVYVGCHDGGDILVLSTKVQMVIWAAGGARGPCYAVALPDGSRVYVCANMENRIWVIGRATSVLAADPLARK
jgi:YVTN family beta-propeller protein